MPITKNNFSHVSDVTIGSVDASFLTVDFINTMVAETGDVTSGSATAGLELVRNIFGNEGIQVIGEGALANANTTKTYMVGSHSLDTLSSTTSVARLQAAIRAANGNGNVTQTISSATVTDLNLSDTSLGIS
jgi:hypothetical protein